MTTLPTTPAECRAEQERVLKLLSNADTPESWYYQPGWGLQKHNAEGLGLIAGQSDFATHGDLLLLEAAPTLARQYATLLAAHAEALERERERWIPVELALPENGEEVLFAAEGKRLCGFRLDSAWYRMTGRTYDAGSVTHWQPLPPPPAQAPAGGE